ncbi:hypothetical protein GCM10027610_049830 [Dactylosporangium cerinum]
MARIRSCASTAAQFATVKSWNAAGSSTGPPSSRTTPNSRFGCRFGGGTDSSSPSSTSSPLTARASRSYTGEMPRASPAANWANQSAVGTQAPQIAAAHSGWSMNGLRLCCQAA